MQHPALVPTAEGEITLAGGGFSLTLRVGAWCANSESPVSGLLPAREVERIQGLVDQSLPELLPLLRQARDRFVGILLQSQCALLERQLSPKLREKSPRRKRVHP